MQRLYNIAGGGSRVSGVNMGNFYTVCTARRVWGGARHPASLMHSLRHLPFLPPAGEKAPQGNFCHERQKSPKTPVETHGFHPSFPRRTAQFAQLVTARQNRREKTSLKCCMATAPPSLVRLPVQNVGDIASTFQSGAAAKREAGTIPDLHQNAFLTTRVAGTKIFSKTAPCKEVKEPLVPCGVSFPLFPLCPKNTSHRRCVFG